MALTKQGRQDLLGLVGIHPKSEPLPPDIKTLSCCVPGCDGLCAVNGHCFKCNVKFAAAVTCPACGWKQGVLNADKFDFICRYCHAHVADS